MSDSARKGSMNRDTVNNNETIFEFLKRKKQFNLENTVNKSQRNSSTKRKVDFEIDEDLPQTRDLTKYRTTEQYNSYTSRPNITPKKIQFQEPEHQPKSAVKASYQQYQQVQQNQHKRGKSFLSMISPIKNNRPSSALQERDENRDQQYTSRSVIKTGKSENYTRKNVTKCINSIKEIVNTLNQNINKIQDKSHGLTVLFKPFFNSITNPNEQLTMQIGDLKNKLRSFQSLVEGASVENSDEVVEEFHKNLEDHVQSELHHLRKELEKDKNEQILTFKKDKQLQIQKLQFQIKKISKDNDILNRRLEKTENHKEKIQQAVTQREINYVQQLERYKITSETTIQQLKMKNSELQAQLETAQQQSKEGQKRYKNQRMVKQSVEAKFREQIQQITEAKDAFLLNEIMVLKAEFNSDIARMNDLHKIKESQLLDRISKKEQLLSRKIFQNGCDKQLQTKILQQANQIKQENISLRAKSQCIVTDMYRMNEELYQHWMALKDIKLLSNRLGSYLQFKKIYEDLRFNDHLFQ